LPENMRRFMTQRAAEFAQRRASFGAAAATPTPRAQPPSKNLTVNCFHLGGRTFHYRPLPSTQKGCAELHNTSTRKRDTNKANLLQRSRHCYSHPIRVLHTPGLAHAPPTHQAHRTPTHTSSLFFEFCFLDSWLFLLLAFGSAELIISLSQPK
jgi:hypothetical protein